MKKLLLSSVFVFLLIGAGCQTQKEQSVLLPPAVEELQTQTVPESKKQEISSGAIKTEQTHEATILYKGAWFDIEYLQNFTAKPTTPTKVYNGITRVLTDEANFIALDGTVEFFVYSPLWSGNPEAYLTIAPTEEIVSEKTDEIKESDRQGQFGGEIVHWITVKAKDGSYYRSFVSIKKQVGTGSDLHHVFGIKYQDSVAYEKYRTAYIAFKESLRQYAD